MATSRQMSGSRQFATPNRFRLPMLGLERRLRERGPYRSLLASLSYVEMNLARLPEAAATTKNLGRPRGQRQIGRRSQKQGVQLDVRGLLLSVEFLHGGHDDRSGFRLGFESILVDLK